MAGRTCPVLLVKDFNRPTLDTIVKHEDAWSPRLLWICSIVAADLNGPAVVAQSTTLTFATDAVVAGTLRLTFTGGALDAPVVVDVAVAAGDSDSDIAAAAELAIDGEGDLAGTVDATADSSADLTIDYEVGIARTVITWEWIPESQAWDVVFAGTIANGDFDTSLAFEGYTPIVVRTTRAAGTPTDEAAMAVQHEADIEADSRLFGLVASADDDGTDTNRILTVAGAPDLVVTCTAPGTATLTPTEVTGEVTVTQAESVTLDLLALQPKDQIPEQILRLKHPRIYRRVAFPASVTMDAGDDDTDAIFAGVAMDGTGTIGDSGTAEGDDTLLEESWSPTATFHFATLPTTGACDLEISYMALPDPRAA